MKHARLRYGVIILEIVLLLVTIVTLILLTPIPWKPVFASPDTATFRPNAAGTYQEWTIFGGLPTRWRATSDQNDATDAQVMVRRVR